jgi:DNA-directed RNA polymerase subunit L|tara:strand:- start:251 stop:1369 length:1119 start_codon:yes stop_codon:yes gene_type:complete
MNPQVEPFTTHKHLFGFTLSGVNVSLANAIRRTVLSDIPAVVFRTSPNEVNKCTIIKNTTRFNNEIIKQRLSCVPIHINDVFSFPTKNYILEVNVENNTDTIMFVTTKDFVILDSTTKKPLDKDKISNIFPPNSMTGSYIDFLRLRPKMSDELSGESIHLTCQFDIATAKEDGMFNVVSTCSYGFTEDGDAQDVELVKKMQTWKDEGKTPEDIKFETANWKLLDAKRICKKDSFDFIIETLGIYSNNEIVDTACSVLIDRFSEVDALIERDELEINMSDVTMKNCHDIILHNEDYTIGKVLEFMMHSKFYETNILTYCGFNKAHPHDEHSVIRVAYKEMSDKSTIKGHLKECVQASIQIYKKIQKDLTKLVK